MKTLNINLNNLLVSVFMLMAMFLVGCEKDTENPVAPIFPELTDIPCSAGETKEITFEANMDWTLTSSAAWCRFVSGDFKETTISGKEGKQTIKIAISDEGLNYESNDEAIVKIEMGGETKEIFKFVRSKKEYKSLIVKDEIGNVYDSEHTLIIKGGGLTENSYDVVNTIITVETDLQVGIKSKPEWLKITQSEPGVFTLNFDRTSSFNYINSINNPDDKLIIATSNIISGTVEDENSALVEIPLSYEGLRDYSIGYASELPFSQHRLILDYESTKFTVSNSMSVEEETFNLPIEVTVEKVRNGEFGYIIGKVSRTELIPNYYTYEYDFEAIGLDSWVKPEINGNNFILNVDKLDGTEERGAIVLLFSKDFIENNKGNYNKVLCDESGYFDSFKYASNVIVEFTQEPKKEETVTLSLKGFVKEAGSTDLKPFNEVPNDAAMINEPNNPMFEVEEMFCKDNFWYVGVDKSFLSNGNEIYLEIIGDIPLGYSAGTVNFWGWNSTNIKVESIENKNYIVVSGCPTKEEIESNPVITVGVANWDMMDCILECGITVFGL